MNQKGQAVLVIGLVVTFCASVLGAWTITSPGATFNIGGTGFDNVSCWGAAGTDEGTVRMMYWNLKDQDKKNPSYSGAMDFMGGAWMLDISPPAGGWVENDSYGFALQEKSGGSYSVVKGTNSKAIE